MYIELLVDDQINHVIIRVTGKNLDKIIKKIRESTGLSKKGAMRYWKDRMDFHARRVHNAKGKVDFEIIKR